MQASRLNGRLASALLTVGLALGWASPGLAALANSAGSPAALVSSAGTTKVTVERTARDAFLASAAASKATLIADYGSFAAYRIVSADAAVARLIEGVEVRADFDTILLRRGPVNSTSGWRVPDGQDPAARPVPERNLGLVQFHGPVNKAARQALLVTGAAIVHYMPQNAYIVWTQTPEQRKAILAQVGEGKSFAFFDEYTSSDALSPELDSKLFETGDVDVTVQVYNVDAKAIEADPNASADVRQVLALATGIIQPPHVVLGGLYTNMTIRVPALLLGAIAAQDAVVNVEPYTVPIRHSERQALEMAGSLNAAGTGPLAGGPSYLTWLAGRGFPTTPASYPILTITDDGIDGGSTSPIDQTLRAGGTSGGTSRIVFNFNATTDTTANGVQGHGHLNTTIALGHDTGLGALDGGVYRRAMGINPYGRIGGFKIFNNLGNYSVSGAGGTDASVIAAEYNQGANISSNSWGGATTGAYNATAQAYDAGTRDATSALAGNQPLLFIFSAGNAGSAARTVASPGTAKNVLTVGACEDTDNDGTDGCTTTAADADNIQQIVGFSSRGPCADGRKKPEIVAPGTHISGRANPAAGYNGVGVCDQYWPTGQTIYARSSGTSHSTPAVSGMASLVWNYLNRQYGIVNPSPALVKAYIIHNARYLAATAGTLPDAAQGYGLANMDPAFSSAVPRILVDQTSVLSSTGDTQSISGAVADGTKPVRVTLVWTDAPGPTTGNAWVNDLNLTVTVNGVPYKGNAFVGANTAAGGVFDTANNTESVFLPAGITGAMTVTVTAANLAGNGVPSNSDSTDQDYALVIYNMTQSGVALSGTGANVIADTTGNGNANGRIDPGESSIRLTIQIQNSGPSAATGVSATLVSNTSTVTVPTATSSYPNLPATTGSGVNTTPFVINVSPSHPCGAPVNLTLNISSAQGTGSYLLSLPTGSGGGPATATFSYSGPVVAIPDNNTTGATVSLPVSGTSGSISKVTFRFNGSSCSSTAGATTVGLDHSYVGDLTISLQSPSGTSVTLMNRLGGTGNNLCNTVFDDAGATSISTITPTGNPYSNTYVPASLLSAFNGQTANGNWLLKVVDNAAQDTGSIRAFSVIITTQTVPVCDPPAASCTPVTISTPPASQSVCGGEPIDLSVTPAGTPPFTYQWRKGTSTITGATLQTYSIPTAASADSGEYSCVVNNTCGSATSTVATVTVSAACSVADLPQSGACPDGTVDGADFVAFINSFALGDVNVDPLADVAGGGPTGNSPDGTIDGADFVAFINAFAVGC